MKKLTALLLAVMLVASMAVAVSAENTTTLTTTVPAATYTLNIPADQEIPFGVQKTDIGEISVTNSTGFADGKNLKVTFTYADFESASNSTTIPFELTMLHSEGFSATSVLDTWKVKSGESIEFRGNTDGTVEETVALGGSGGLCHVGVIIKSSSWGKALAGDYTATITFTAEVVVE